MTTKTVSNISEQFENKYCEITSSDSGSNKPEKWLFLGAGAFKNVYISDFALDTAIGQLPKPLLRTVAKDGASRDFAHDV